jgi:hypothetical protein
MGEYMLFRYYWIGCLLIFTGGAFAMNLNNIGKVCLFSQMTGVIYLNNKPVVRAKLIRTADRDGAVIDEVFTDAHGHFEFPAVFERTMTKFLPQEFVASQKIIVLYDGKEYELWNGVKRKPEENTESRGKPLIVKCELGAERNYKRINGSPIFSLCDWDVEPDPKFDMELF